MENKTLTAVEWLVRNFMLNGLIRLTKDEHSLYKELTDLAKQMEKEQIIHAWREGDNDSMYSPKELDQQAEQYYNETYGKSI